MADAPQGEATPNLDAYLGRKAIAPEAALSGDSGPDEASLAFLEEFEGTKAELGALKSQMSKLSKESDDHSRFKEGLRNFVAPGSKKDVDPDVAELSEIEADLSEMIELLNEAKRQGKEYPITAKTKKALEQVVRAKKNEIELKKRLGSVETKIDQANNPQVKAENATFDNLNSILRSSMDTLFGAGFEMQEQKDGNAYSISKQVDKHINELRNNDPDAWAQIVGNKKHQERLINFFVEKNIPPRARQILAEQKLKETPITEEFLWASFREADGIKDAEERAKIKTKLRQDILEIHYAPKGRMGSVKKYNAR